MFIVMVCGCIVGLYVEPVKKCRVLCIVLVRRSTSIQESK